MSCCTCATLLDALPEQAELEKPLRHRRLDCCGRVVCQPCLDKNPRFANYCPYCPSTEHLAPPTYEPPPQQPRGQSPPPPYADDERASIGEPWPRSHGTTLEENGDLPPKFAVDEGQRLEGGPPPPPCLADKNGKEPSHEKQHEPPHSTDQVPIIHHLRHPHDTIASLSLRYGVPADELRAYNRLTSDHLLAARRTLAIPPGYATSGSLSPVPVEDPAETERKAKIRRFMMGCRCPDYDLAVVYLEAAEWNVDVAAGRWVDDELWETENPVRSSKEKGKGKAKGKEDRGSSSFWRRR